MNGVGTRSIVRSVLPSETVSEAVVLAVLGTRADPGAGTDEAPIDHLEPLSETLDTDALDSLFGDRFDGRLEFDWSGCSIVVDGGTRVVVRASA